MPNELDELIKKVPLRVGDDFSIRLRDKYGAVVRARKFADAAEARRRDAKKAAKEATKSERELSKMEVALIKEIREHLAQRA